jgi:hypothetical protein
MSDDRQLSQRTLVRIAEAFRDYFNAGNDWLAEFLYEHDFKDWFVNRARELLFDWFKVVRYLRSGEFFFRSNRWDAGTIIDRYAMHPTEAISRGEQLLRRLAALAVTFPDGDQVIRSLELDGFRANQAKLELVPLDSIVSEQAEEDRLASLVNATTISNSTVILKHLHDADDLFVQGKDHSSISESRSFLQALIDGVSGETNALGGHASIGYPSGTANRLKYLEDVGFFTSDEKTAFGSAWGFLSGGAHPGIPSHDSAHIGLILALEFGLFVLLKFGNWKANGYKRFNP